MKYSEYLIELKKHEEQKKLEAYQLSRTLPRPKTNKWHIALYISLYIAVDYALCQIFFAPLAPILKVLVFLVSFCLFSEFYLRFIGIKAVECYQHYAGEERRRRCLCIPSCSEYAIIVLKKHCLIKALMMIRKRLYKTCRGDEYKIDRP